MTKDYNVRDFCVLIASPIISLWLLSFFIKSEYAMNKKNDDKLLVLAIIVMAITVFTAKYFIDKSKNTDTSLTK